MTDKELLELAAKAAGIQVYYEAKWRWYERPPAKFVRLYEGEPTTSTWNPLTDDGDALRLAVKLKIDIDNMTDACYAEGQFGHDAVVDICDCGGDPYAATRRAIFLAAAKIGKEMKNDG